MHWFRRVTLLVTRRARSPYFPLLGFCLAFVATIVATAFVPVLSVLVAARGKQWGLLVLACALGSALGASVLAWIAANYGPAILEQWLPRVMSSQQWLSGVRWVEDYGYLALFAFAALPLSQTPVLIVCALAGMSVIQVFLAIFVGKFAKYAVSAAAVTAAARRIADMQSRASPPEHDKQPPDR